MVSGGMDAPGNDQVCRRLRSFGVQFSGDVSLLRSLCFRCISLFCCFVSFSFFSDVVLVERGLIDVGYAGSPSLRLPVATSSPRCSPCISLFLCKGVHFPETVKHSPLFQKISQVTLFHVTFPKK